MRRRILLGGSEIDYSTQYLTFTALESGTFSLVVPASVTSSYITGGVSYSTDDGATWTTTAITSSAQTITTPTINAGGKVLWKAVTRTFSSSNQNCCKFQATGNFDVSGNIMSLLYGDDFIGQTAFGSYDYIMRGLFYGNTKVKSAENIILPATTLMSNCYNSMFQGCTSLTTAPTLPATTLATRCYEYMFDGCTSLTTAPELPATTLVNGCYYAMFYGCTSLTTAPTLPATTLASYCYYQMFKNCTSLTTAPELPATTLKEGCYNSMFQGCTSLTTAPTLPATTLASYCYYQMFRNCTSLNSITCLATDISAPNCTIYWVYGVAASGTFTKAASMSSWNTGANSIPSGWTVENRIDYSQQYFTIVSRADNNVIKLVCNISAQKTVEVSTDKITWTSYTTTTSGVTLATLNSGQKLYVRGNNSSYADSTSKYSNFTTTGYFDVEGNIMSLLYGDNFAEQTSYTATYTFVKMFVNCANLINAKNLILSVRNAQGRCYYSMFSGCTNLITAPEITAISLSTNSCTSMFNLCTSLTKAPNIAATSLGKSSCSSMFSGCTSLIKTPILASATLTESCYNGMFSGCSNLNYVTMLATDISATDCLTGWLTNVAATGTFVKDASMTTLPSGVSGIPSGWTTVDYEE